jgi:hypothetical protein
MARGLLGVSFQPWNGILVSGSSIEFKLTNLWTNNTTGDYRCSRNDNNYTGNVSPAFILPFFTLLLGCLKWHRLELLGVVVISKTFIPVQLIL